MATTSSRNEKKPPRRDIPHHLIFQEVLPRLPATSLLRFKSVAREWKSVISDKEFVKTHVDHPNYLSSRSVLTLAHDFSSFKVLDYGGLNMVSKKFVKEFSGSYKSLISSCNGLVLMISSSEDSRDDVDSELPECLFRFDFRYVVFNPILGSDHYVEIPHPRDRLRIGGNNMAGNYSFGFGYDSATDDYYIVSLNLPQQFHVLVHVYSLRSRKWTSGAAAMIVREKTLPLLFQDFWNWHAGTLVKETLYWGILQGREHQFIFAFNLATRKHFKLVPFPPANFHNYSSALGCLNDCLCAWADYDDFVDMWLLKQSWTKLYHIQTVCCCRDFFGFTKSGMVLVFIDTDMLILSDFTCDPAILLDTVSDETLCAVSYVPSLVSVPR